MAEDQSVVVHLKNQVLERKLQQLTVAAELESLRLQLHKRAEHYKEVLSLLDDAENAYMKAIGKSEESATEAAA